MEYIYLMYLTTSKLYKVGRTIDIERRKKEHERSNNQDVKILMRRKVDDPKFHEKKMISRFEEIFGKPSKGKEYFEVDKKSYNDFEAIDEIYSIIINQFENKIDELTYGISKEKGENIKMENEMNQFENKIDELTYEISKNNEYINNLKNKDNEIQKMESDVVILRNLLLSAEKDTKLLENEINELNKNIASGKRYNEEYASIIHDLQIELLKENEKNNIEFNVQESVSRINKENELKYNELKDKYIIMKELKTELMEGLQQKDKLISNLKYRLDKIAWESKHIMSRDNEISYENNYDDLNKSSQSDKNSHILNHEFVKNCSPMINVNNMWKKFTNLLNSMMSVLWKIYRYIFHIFIIFILILLVICTQQ
jgi:chromosome segregation ATPase